MFSATPSFPRQVATNLPPGPASVPSLVHFKSTWASPHTAAATLEDPVVIQVRPDERPSPRGFAAPSSRRQPVEPVCPKTDHSFTGQGAFRFWRGSDGILRGEARHPCSQSQRQTWEQRMLPSIWQERHPTQPRQSLQAMRAQESACVEEACCRIA